MKYKNNDWSLYSLYPGLGMHGCQSGMRLLKHWCLRRENDAPGLTPTKCREYKIRECMQEAKTKTSFLLVY